MVFDKKRIISGLFLLVFLYLIFFFKINYLLIFLLIILAFYDLTFSKIITLKKLIIYNLPILLAIVLYHFFDLNPLYLPILFFLFLILCIHKTNNNIFILILVDLFFFILIYLNNFDDRIIFILIFISFLNDTVAYIVGKTIGGPLIIPNISPNKTWSGTLSSFLVSYSFLYILNFNLIECLLIALSLFFGDLLFSQIKRKYSIKDFSNIIPGHGGILDRIDSIFLSTVIVFTFKIL